MIGHPLSVVASKARRADRWLGGLLWAAWCVLGVCLLPVALVALQAVPRLRVGWRDRLGLLKPPPRWEGEAGARVWFHAASVGDVRAVVPVVEALLAEAPDVLVACTTQTRGGLEVARRELPPSCAVFGAPLDCWPCVALAWRALRPRVLVVEYLELWPCMLDRARRLGVPALLQNARLSPRRRARYVRGLTGALYRHMARALVGATARDEGDADTLRALGVEVWEVCAHTKHATLRAPTAAEVGALRVKHGLEERARDDVWLAASVHVGDLRTVCDAAACLHAAGHRVRPLLCPRYPEDAPRFAAALRARGLRVRVSPSARGDSAEAEADAVIVATTGELRVLYGCAAVAVIGGTFCGRGGQNPAEAAAAGCLTVVGPNTAQIDPELRWVPAAARVPDSGRALADAIADTVGWAAVEDAAALTRAAQGAARRQAARVLGAVEGR